MEYVSFPAQLFPTFTLSAAQRALLGEGVKQFIENAQKSEQSIQKCDT